MPIHPDVLSFFIITGLLVLEGFHDRILFKVPRMPNGQVWVQFVWPEVRS